MEIGIHVYGRHLEALGWENLVWGEPPDKLGSLAVLARELLDAFVRGDDVIAVVFGTGACEKNGLKEAEYTKRFLLEHSDELSEFASIRNHPGFQTAEGQRFLKERFAEIICEVKSQTTLQEVENVAAIFAERGITHVIDISCGSHLPRCIVTQRQAREAGKIPPEQRWYFVADDMTFVGLPIQKSVVILEAPHRGDDPMVQAALKPHEVVPVIFGLTVPQRVEVLDAMKRHMERIKEMNIKDA